MKKSFQVLKVFQMPVFFLETDACF